MRYPSTKKLSEGAGFAAFFRFLLRLWVQRSANTI
jgi:hypothetical protein